MYSTAATTGGEGDGGTLAQGLFGSVNVEAVGAEWYRSQVTQSRPGPGDHRHYPQGQPIINYDAVYPSTHPGRQADPQDAQRRHDRAYRSQRDHHWSQQGTLSSRNLQAESNEPDRERPFREFTVVYHDEIKAVQAFPQFESNQHSNTHFTASVMDLPSTTAWLAQARKSWPTGSESARCSAAPSASLKFFLSSGPLAIRRS